MKLKNLKIELSKLKTFESPNILLEQYITPGEIAATIAQIADNTYNDIKNKTVLDLCCGTGMLGISFSFFNPSFIYYVDVCKDALSICKENLELFDKQNFSIIRADVTTNFLKDKIDTCVINPPFGTRNKGIDVKTIKFALEISKVVYVVHTSHTRDFYLKKFKNIKLLGKINYELPKTYKFHKKAKKTISVDLFRITK